MAVIGSLSVKLGLVTVDWDKATSQAKRQAKDLQNAFNDLGLGTGKLKTLFNNLGGSAGLAMAGFATMAKSVLELAGNLQDISKTYDVSIAKVLQFQNALIQTGGKAEDAGKIMATMFSKIAEAQQGNEAAISHFERLGISFKELRTMSPEQALTRVYEGLANIGNTYNRIKLVKEILGKGGLHKSVEEIAQALGQSTAEFRSQEEAMKAWADMGDRGDRALLNLKLAFAGVFKVLTGVEFVPSVNQFKSAMVAITAAATINGMLRLVAAFKTLNGVLKTTAALGVAITSVGGVAGLAMAGGGLAAYYGAMKAFEGQDEKDAAAGELPVKTGKTGAGSTESDNTINRRVIAAGQAKIDLAKKMLDFDRRRHEYQIGSLISSQDELALGESAIKREEDIAKAMQTRAEALKEENLSSAQKGLIQKTYDNDVKKAQQERTDRDELIMAKRQLAIDILVRQIENENTLSAIKGDQARLENDKAHMTAFEYDKQKESLALQEKLLQIDIQKRELNAQWKGNKYSSEYLDGMALLNNAEETERQLSSIRQRGIEEDRMRSEDFVTGWNYAFEQYRNSANDYGQLGGQAFNSAVGTMNSALETFVRTGKLSFTDLASSIIQDLIKIQLKMQATKLFNLAMDYVGSIGTANQFGTIAGSQQTLMLQNQMKGFADGGSPPVGRPSIVGERGAELFIPKQAGTVIPNNQLSSVLGQGTTINYNAPVVENLSAIDTQSGIQFLAKNKMTIWGMNQSANRSIPVGR